VHLNPTAMWLQLCLWFGVAASLPSFPTQNSLEKFPTKPSLSKKKSARSSRGLPREGLSWSGGDSTSSTVPTVRHCSSPSGSVDGRILVEEEGGGTQDFTTITWQIGLGETLCYRFKSETGSLSGTVEVTYVSLKSVYSIQDSYKFPLALSTISCLCDCPGGASQCSSTTDLCGNATNCANYYSPSVPATGCFFSFLKLSAALCCSVQVVPAGSEKYRAVQLGVPSVLAQFNTVYKDEQGEVVDTRQYSIDLNSGTTIDWDVSLQVSSPGPSTLVPPGWYVVPDTPGQQHSLLAGLDVNPLEGWDPAKVGWVKAGPDRTFVTSGLRHLLQYFTPQVQSCSQGKYTGSFSGGQINRELGGRHLTEVFPFIRLVRVWRRHAELLHKESPLLTLTLQHRTKVGVVVQYSSSQLTDFTGLLYQDSLSHRHLNLSLFGASGTITGQVSGASHSQSILLRLSLYPSNSSHQIQLSSLTQCRAGQVTVSLRPLAATSLTIRKKLPCVTESLRTFRSAREREGRAHAEIRSGDFADCLSCSASWAHWLDPSHWLDSAWPKARIVIAGCSIVLVLVLLILVSKCIRSLCCCCD